MKKLLYTCCLLVLALRPVQAQLLEIKPAKPQRGDLVTVTYHAGTPGAKIGAGGAAVNMIFTYSTLYDLPYKLPMVKNGDNWVASFALQRYATFATFYLQSGDIIEKPADDQHFAIAVYQGDKRIKSGLLHEAYSLSAQKPKSKDLQASKLALLKQELDNYPDNYEARVALLNTEMLMTKQPEEKLKYREEARKIIAEQLEKNPTFGGNINLVTMGYLMIGEKTRIDSVRKVIMNRYPDADVSIDLRAGIIAKEKDSTRKITQLKALLKKSKKGDEEGPSSIHRLLFEHYVAVKDSAQALQHAVGLVTKTTPYTAETLKDIADGLTRNKMAPAAAISYAERSFKIADTWPVGVIRYFPEYGYILPFVADTVRAKVVSEAKGNLLSIIALNKLYQHRQKDALNEVNKALTYADSHEGLINVASVYGQTGNYKKAFDVLWRLLLKNPTDTTVLKMAQTNFLKFNNSNAEFNVKVDELKVIEIAQLTKQLTKEMLNKPTPELAGLVDLEGKTITADQMKGKIVVFDFWATWCVPCMQELPYLQKVYQKYRDNPKVKFMVVNSGANNTIDDARKWTKQNKQYTFPVYFNNDKDIGDKVGFAFIPTVAVIDQNGVFQFRTIGFEGEILEKKLTAEIEILLNKK